MDDIQDRTADIVNGRAARRAAEKSQKRASDYAMSRANLSGVTSPGGSTLFDYGSETKSAEAAQLRRMAEYRKSDWRDAYLPGRDVDNVMGIDIETTGTDPARVYIIDVGFEYMNMISSPCCRTYWIPIRAELLRNGRCVWSVASVVRRSCRERDAR